MSGETKGDAGPPYVEEVELRGHIIDSLLLPKILDCITTAGGSFLIKEISVGQHRADPSSALIQVGADSPDQLQEILATIGDHGAVPTHTQDACLEAADIAGAFPEGFYSSTNQRTELRVHGQWIAVRDQEMDCGLTVDPQRGTARCVPMSEVVVGMPIVTGHAGIRVIPEARRTEGQVFEFMSSEVSTEKPKGAAMRQIAREMFRARHNGERICVVAGPAIVHTGSGEHFCRLVRGGYVDLLLAGNALATHDIEQAMFGTSLGVHLELGHLAEAGHEHHLRAINRVRRAGSIREAVDTGILTSGIMYECVQAGVDYVLAGSIRDDGPLPDVITDALEAQRIMRTKLRDVTFCLMVATTLHSIAVGNLLPSWVRVVCVDINPSTAIKLNDRGSFQTVGLVTDVQPFLRVLVQEIEALEASQPAGPPNP